MDKEYKQDKKYWVRMGLELEIAYELISQILCDHDYNYMMPKAIWDKLFRAGDILRIVKSQAEDRMFVMTPFQDTRIFYPIPPENLIPGQMVDEFRQKVREAADGET